MKKFRDKEGNIFYPSKTKNGYTYKMFSKIKDSEGYEEPYFSDENELRVSVYDDGSKDYLRIPLNQWYQLKDYDMYIYPYDREREWSGLRCISFFIGEHRAIIDDNNVLQSGYNDDYDFEIGNLSDDLVQADLDDIIRFVFRDDLEVYADLNKLFALITSV